MRTLVVALALAACGHPSRAPEVVGPAPRPAAASAAGPKVGEYVVVSHAARFFSAADEGRPSFRAQTAPAKDDATADAADGIVLRVLGARAGWVEVENPAAADLPGHCQQALGELDAFHLHFFVREH